MKQSLMFIPTLRDIPAGAEIASHKILLKGGFILSEKLFNEYDIEDERTNDKTTLLLCGIGTSKKKLDRLKKVLKNFSF